MDRLDRNRRSWNMGRIKGRNTIPEVVVRSILHRSGFRFSLHRKDLPGKPDIVLPKRLAVIFVHGCFWHRHKECKYCYMPKSNVDFWRTKFRGNVARDRKNVSALRKAGWRVIVIWECELVDRERLQQKLRKLLNAAD
jgi:DNA mismatch endonuclease, patch repair protein